MMRFASPSSKRLKAERRRAGGGRAGAALTGDRDRGGDVVRLLECGAQRLDLAEVELPVPAGGAARLGEAEAALPAAKRVRADAEHRCGCVRSDDAHAESCRPLRRFSQARAASPSARTPQPPCSASARTRCAAGSAGSASRAAPHRRRPPSVRPRPDRGAAPGVRGDAQRLVGDLRRAPARRGTGDAGPAALRLHRFDEARPTGCSRRASPCARSSARSRRCSSRRAVRRTTAAGRPRARLRLALLHRLARRVHARRPPAHRAEGVLIFDASGALRRRRRSSRRRSS